MKYKEFQSPLLRRIVKPDEPDYLKHYKAALIFELNHLNQQNCYCSGCVRIREETEAELKEIFNLKYQWKVDGTP